MKNFITITTLIAGMTLSGAALADQVQGQQQQSQASAGSYNDGNNQSINFEGDAATKIPKQAPSIAAPALTTTLSETCMGSTSMGASMAGFGLTFGSTWSDEACVRRLDARELRTFGAGLNYDQAILFHLAAKERMCEDGKIKSAFQRVADLTGNSDALCQESRAEAKAAAAPKASGYVAPVATTTETNKVEMDQQERNEAMWERNSAN